MTNIELLESTMQYIKDHPERHDQGMWTCETGACFAGTAVLRNGFQLIYERGVALNGSVQDKDGNDYTVSVLATELLDLSHDDAKILFHGKNTREVLELMVKDLANGEALEGHWEFVVPNEGNIFSAHYERKEEV